MKTVQIGDKEYSIPGCWNELTAAQLVEIMDACYVRKYEPLTLLMKFFKILIDVSYRTWRKLKPEEIDELLYLVTFLFEEKTNLTKQLLPVYDRLYGPSDDIGNMLMGEFTFSEHYFLKWKDDRTDDDALNHFVAAIYRPAKKNYDFRMNPDGDCREKFNQNISARYADDIISKWPLKIKLAIVTWYGGCRQQLVDRYPDVFGGSGEPAKYGLIQIMMNIAKEGTHGDFESVENKSVHLMMIHMNINVEEMKRAEQEAKK